MPISDSQALEAHFKYFESTATAEVCAANIRGYQAKFDRLFTAWRLANAEALHKGAALAEAKGWHREDGPTVQAFARGNAELIAQIPAADRQRRCDELLVFLKSAQPPG